MKRILLSGLFAGLLTGTVLGQDAATQAQIEKLTGQIQDLNAAIEQQNKRIDTLQRDLNELRDKVNTPAANPDNASRDDLKSLAEKVQEIDKKRQADRELILKEIDKLGRLAAAGGAPAPRKSTPTKTTTSAGEDGGTAAPPQKGYEYTVQKGDTLPAIAKAYRDQGVKVTTAQIIKANPSLDPNKLFVGKKIFIPDPSAK